MKEVYDNELSEDGQVHNTSLSMVVLSIFLQLLLTPRGLLASLGNALLEYDAGWLLSGSTELQICCALFHPSRHDGSLPLVGKVGVGWAGKLGPLRQRRKVGEFAEAMVLPCFQVLKCLSICPLHRDNCCTVKCCLLLIFCLKEVGFFEGCTTNLFVNSCRVVVGWEFVC